MREIKFRAWHKDAEQMLYPEYQSSAFQWLIEGQLIEIMQFTGLHDKNGREIYEGDILGLNEIYTAVVFHEASFSMDSQSENRMPSPLHSDRTRMYTVAGNIYENPELLK